VEGEQGSPLLFFCESTPLAIGMCGYYYASPDNWRTYYVLLIVHNCNILNKEIAWQIGIWIRMLLLLTT